MIAVLALLAGCAVAMTPQEIRERGEQHDIFSTRSPEDLTACLARNAERQGALYNTTVRRAEDGAIELLVHKDYTGAVVRTYPADSGSRASGWIFPAWAKWNPEFWPAVIEGC